MQIISDHMIVNCNNTNLWQSIKANCS